jgi:dTDP-D-glucose 4,6-dehydratase
MPTNLYGYGDNYDLKSSHVLPALIRKFHEAKLTNQPFVEVWGTGKPKREFLFADDLADACLFLMYTYNEKEEPEEDWRSPANIRWIFSYRCNDNASESFYQFPKMNELEKISILQPLKGLSSESVDEAFKDFSVSEEFKQAVISKSEIITFDN